MSIPRNIADYLRAFGNELAERTGQMQRSASPILHLPRQSSSLCCEISGLVEDDNWFQKENGQAAFSPDVRWVYISKFIVVKSAHSLCRSRSSGSVAYTLSGS
jgi:hypothetical protein